MGYEPINSASVKEWAYQLYKKKDCVFRVERHNEGIDIVRAEVVITDEAIEKFPELEGVEKILMYPADKTKPVDRKKFDNDSFSTEEYFEPLASCEIEYYYLKR